jgi:hypothetical protein
MVGKAFTAKLAASLWRTKRPQIAWVIMSRGEVYRPAVV